MSSMMSSTVRHSSSSGNSADEHATVQVHSARPSQQSELTRSTRGASLRPAQAMSAVGSEPMPCARAGAASPLATSSTVRLEIIAGTPLGLFGFAQLWPT